MCVLLECEFVTLQTFTPVFCKHVSNFSQLYVTLANWLTVMCLMKQTNLQDADCSIPVLQCSINRWLQKNPALLKRREE